MTEDSAIKVALGLLHLPASLRRVLSEPLPSDVATLLRIVSGDEDAKAAAALTVNRPREMVHDAAVFYVEQILLHPDADCYRILGSTPSASNHDLRRNMALLLSWLHPDKNPSSDRSVLAARVTGAWNTLRNPERRAAYDAALAKSRRTAAHVTRPHPTKSRTNGAGGLKHAQSTLPPTLPHGSNGKTGARPRPLSASHTVMRRDAGFRTEDRRSLLSRGLAHLLRVLRDRSSP